jgi:hypothetical protein
MLKEPLLHFLLLGALIFLTYAVVGDGGPADHDIVLTNAQQQRLLAAFVTIWKRPPTQAEYESILEEWIREEMSYREGVAMGLDTDDAIIRRRVRQKVELLAEEIVSLTPPSTEELESFLAENQHDYMGEPRFTLRQVTFSFDQRREAAKTDAEQALMLLSVESPRVHPESLGDPIPLPFEMVGASEASIAARFGREFVDAIRTQQPGGWRGPIRSGFGLHLVIIDEYLPAEPPTLQAVERAVRRDWERQRQTEATERLYEELAKRYTINVEMPESAEAS